MHWLEGKSQRDAWKSDSCGRVIRTVLSISGEMMLSAAKAIRLESNTSSWYAGRAVGMSDWPRVMVANKWLASGDRKHQLKKWHSILPCQHLCSAFAAPLCISGFVIHFALSTVISVQHVILQASPALPSLSLASLKSSSAHCLLAACET